MKYFKTLFLSLLVSVAGLFLFSPRASAAPPNIQPENPDIYYTVSAGTTDGKGNNLLYSPEIWIRVYGGTNDGGTINFIHGNHCNAGDGWDTDTFRKTNFELHGAYPNGSIRLFDVKSSVTNKLQPSAGGSGCGTVSLNIPAGALTLSSDSSHVSPYNTRLYTGIIKVYMNPVTPEEDGPLNVFKIEGNGYWTGSIATAGWGIESTQTFLGRPSNNTKNTYNLPFKPPCSTFSGATTSINASLSWFDDDNGTWYQPRFNLRLYEFDEGPGLTGANIRIITERSGEGKGASTVVTLRKGKKYVWQWEGITNKNGVQVNYPYESIDFYFTCPDPPKPFDLVPYASVDVDSENPSIASFGGGVRGNQPTVNGVTISRQYEVRRINSTKTAISPSTAALINQTINSSGIILGIVPRNVESFNYKAGDKICAITTVTPGSGKVNSSGSIVEAGASKSREDCETIVNKPYVSFYGGDVNTCGEIKTFYDNGAGRKRGSGVQYIAQANGTINEFISGSLLGRLPNILSFANTTGTYGGSLGGSCSAPGDYFSGAPTPAETLTSPINLSSLNGNTVKSYNGDAELSGGVLNNRSRTALYIDGDLRITGNIGYANPSWPSEAEIPSLHVYVKGNIYIQPNVTNLTGFFVAQQKVTTDDKGIIFTCANGNARVTTNQLTSCALQLSVRGAFSSKRTYFDRGFKSLRDGKEKEVYGASNAAEKFFIGPEMYFVSPGAGSTGGGNSSGDGYQFITTLPPVL